MERNEIDITEVIGDWFRRRGRDIREHFEEYDLNKASIAHRISLTLILVVSLVVRLFPLFLGWDPHIKAFDPWMQLRAADHILNHGFWNFLVWWDNYSWYPWGRQMGVSMYIGIPLAIVLVYKILTFVGFNITLQMAAYLVPIIFGTITVYFTYLLGKELVSPRGGLFAALIMSVTPSFVSRSIGGFVDNEAIGVLFTVMTLYFFARAFLRDSNRSALMAGISMFLLASSWGAFRFTYDLLPIVGLVFIITGKMSARFIKAYVTTVSVSTLLMIMVPRVGGKFMGDFEGIVPVAFIGFMVLFSIFQSLSNKLSPESFRKMILLGFISLAILLGGLFLILLSLGIVDNIGSKFISVILPTTRNELPLIDSVSEHLPLAWGSLYSNLSTLVFFIPVGVYYAIKQPSEKNVFILTVSLITIYFSGSMVRLMLILAPAAAILSALAIDNLLIPYAYATHGRIKLTKITMSLPSIGGQNAAGSYLVVFALLFFMLNNGVNAAANRFSAPEITPGNNPEESFTDWLEAFSWMRENTAYDINHTEENGYAGLSESQPPVMLSWWDYGYYITANGRTTTLVDNATTNSTQIGTVGTMLMWNSTASINLMYMYNVQYVLVVPTAGQLGLGSDIGKSIWMIRIAEKYTPEFRVNQSHYYNSRTGQYIDKYYDSVLYKLMAFNGPGMSDQDTTGAGRPPFCTASGCSDQVTQLLPDLRDEEVNEGDLLYFKEVFRSTGILPDAPGQYPFVRIFEVQYPDDMEQRVNEFQETMQEIRAQMDE